LVRTFAAVAAAAMMAVASIVLPSPSTTLAAPDISQACSEFFEEFFEVSHGTCVSIGQNLFNNGNAEAVGFCKAFQIFIEREFNETFPLGRCVSEVRRFGFP
jgi:hypothetical protein